MKKILIALVSTFLMSQLAYAECPLEAGETNECDNEQAQVISALAGKEKMKLFTYCLQEDAATLGTQGMQCRSPVVYKNSSTGAFDDAIFEDRFFASELNRLTVMQAYFVKQTDGTYNIYKDNTVDGQLNIDTYRPTQGETNITVTFDSGNRPQWTSAVIEAGCVPSSSNSCTTLNTQFVHTDSYMDLIFPDSTSKRYNKLNEAQIVDP